MPNWCANRLRISGNSSNIERVRTLFAGDGSPAYARAAAEGIQLFLAGCAGVLRPVTDMQYSAYPALILNSGSDTPENRAYTQWLAYLKEGAELTEDNCRVLQALWLACSISSWPWEMLSDEQHAVITALWVQKAGDWRAAFGSDSLAEVWNRLCREDYEPAEAPPFDMLQLIPPRLDVEINGYNGRLLEGVLDGFSETTERCGTKWPHAHGLELENVTSTVFDADFDTPWLPPGEAVLEALSHRYGVTIEHWYAESGCNYCGYAAYSSGVQTEACCASLEWSEEEDEYGYRDVTGPDWIIDNVASYGG